MGKLSPNWRNVFKGALDGYFGTPPETFVHEGKTYTPNSFVSSISINPMIILL
ncbi:MAG: hypothetical protein IPO85_17045 [Saprospiraceae bacterium]|uniref:Uncharacterized protein n=1 Tax=Candidatus Defluviibacterium haderslevense TaxID=2981993 RepID=A0A9D7XIZ6_9BACT|nr:hypothetical protein [Candidatus Defluviibacterium haderslevense]